MYKRHKARRLVMKLVELIERPRLAAQLLTVLAVLVLVTPTLGYYFLQRMVDLLVDGQANAQLLTAEGISTLLNGRPDLFYELPISPEGYEQLYAHPLEHPIRIDGRDNDWEEVLEYSVSFGRIDDATDGTVPDTTQFNVSLGEHQGQLYALLVVRDERLVFRDRNILRLDLSDHLRMTFIDQNKAILKVVITMTEPGVTTAYVIDDDWRYALKGEAENRIPGFMVATDEGYVLEFRLPLDLLGSSRQFGLAIVDVDDPVNRDIKSITGTLPSAGQEALSLVLLKSPEVLRIIHGLGYSGASIQVIDARKRVRAETGSYGSEIQQASGEQDGKADTLWSYNSSITKPVSNFLLHRLWPGGHRAGDMVLSSALEGTATYGYSAEEENVIVAAHPIIDQERTIGAVMLKQNTNRILELLQDALKRGVNLSLGALFLVLILIGSFSWRLAFRIRRLGAEVTEAIDVHGRLSTNKIHTQTGSGDEIGDLARRISGMLARLHQHNQFLFNMPRTLRHEINNPLNTLSTSLHHLEVEESEAARQKYLDAARRGVNKIGIIVQSLADAANLQDALRDEELEMVDLYKLVQNYLNNCRVTHPKREFDYQGIRTTVLCRASDDRVEQLLDKLIDNALDFSRSDSTITVSLRVESDTLTLSVSNQGEPIAPGMTEHIFDNLVSVRGSNPDNRLHFGMGLYVVRVIAEHHGGNATAANLANGRGVIISVTLPVAPLTDFRQA